MTEPVDRLVQANQAWWDERVPIHLASDFYDVEGFRAGRSTLEPFEVAELGELSGRTLAHLQCHFGLDTLSCARLGARVTGLDFSPVAIEAARDLAASVDLRARFEVGSVYDAVGVLRDRFDVVYTGKGALDWLPDLEAWADVVIGLLRPGGLLYLSEFHPFTNLLGDEDLSAEHGYGYFRQEGAIVDDKGGSYADLAASTVHNRTGVWNHPIGEVVTVLAARGLRVEFLHEFPFTLFPRWPWLVRDDGGVYRIPDGKPVLPLMYSLRATLIPPAVPGPPRAGR